MIPLRALLPTALTLALAAATARPAADASSEPLPPRLKRSEAYVGIHFDFHAGPDCVEIGKNTTPQMIAALLQQVRPDYIQIDCKGHPGLSSYPTRVGHPAPGFVGDPLRVWREVTARHGVALYLHYSGIWDSEAVRRHPDWAAVNADGRPDKNATSPFGPYVDRLLLPQLRELAGEYGADGVWVDGDCWAAIPDYGEAAVRAFREATGIETIPRRPDEPHWIEWMDFHREAFRRYLRHYVNEMKRTHPDFEVASNWAFSDHMPEPVSADVAFLSGDFSPQDSVNSARFSARYLQSQGRPWDLMSWAFSGPQGEPARSLKSIPQLCQEAAIVLAQGGGYQAYFKQKRDGSIYAWQMRLMERVARFCRERQSWCHRAEAVPQVALVYSRAAHYRSSPRLFAPWGSEGVQDLKGVLQALLERQYSVEIVSEHHLAGRMHRWPLIVLPNWDYLEPAFRDELVAYARTGGRLLVVGPRAGRLFADEAGVRLDGEPAVERRFLAYNDWHAGLHTPVQRVTPAEGARVWGWLHEQDDPTSPRLPATTFRRLDQGWIAVVWFAFGDRYLKARTPTARDLLWSLAGRLYPEPLVTVTGSRHVDVSLMRKGEYLLVNLVNTAGPHAHLQVDVFDDIPPVGPLQVIVRLPRKPRAVTLEPGNRIQRFGYREGLLHLTLPPVPIHDILAIREAAPEPAPDAAPASPVPTPESSP